MERRPRFEYAGESSDEILTHAETHCVFSVLGGLQWCIQAKARAIGGEDKLTDEERVFLAVLALISEVNNGGYRQFFWNSSRRFTPTIVDSLRRIGCEQTAELTERAIATLGLGELTVDAVTREIQQEHPGRNAKLDALDTEFYSFDEATPHLLNFVLAERARIQAPRTEDYPRFPKRKELSNASKLHNALTSSKRGWNPSLNEVREAASIMAKEKSIHASEADVRGAAALYYLGRISKSGELDGSEGLAQEAFSLMRDDPMHIVVYRKWIEAVLARGKTVTADEHSAAYLEFLKQGGRSKESLQNAIVYWARLVQGHRVELPRSATLFQDYFPHIDLNNLPPERLILPSNELHRKTKPPRVES
jgi:Domain of unknown function (DUF4375)